jgi:hypothetical protein
LFDFRVFVRVSKPDFPRIFCLSFKLFEHQTVRSSRVHCICMKYCQSVFSSGCNQQSCLSSYSMILFLKITHVVRFRSVLQSWSCGTGNKYIILYGKKMGNWMARNPERYRTIFWKFRWLMRFRYDDKGPKIRSTPERKPPIYSASLILWRAPVRYKLYFL